MYTARLTFMSAGGGPSFAASRCSALNFILLNIAQSVITVIARVLDAESTAEGRGLCRVAGQIRLACKMTTQALINVSSVGIHHHGVSALVPHRRQPHFESGIFGSPRIGEVVRVLAQALDAECPEYSPVLRRIRKSGGQTDRTGRHLGLLWRIIIRIRWWCILCCALRLLLF